MGLAELYEKEYLELSRTDGSSEAKDKLNAKHEDISKMVAKLFHKLDALSNFHFTPKHPRSAVEVQANHAPAISMEEIIPMGASKEQLVAPQDLYKKDKQQGLPTARTELTQQERRGKRLAKKRRRRVRDKAKAQEEHDQKKAKERELGIKAVDDSGRKKKSMSKKDKRKIVETIDTRNITFGTESTGQGFGTSSKAFGHLSESQVALGPARMEGGRKKKKKRKSSATHALKL